MRRILTILVFIPVIIEAIDTRFAIAIPGSPYSLGGLIFVFAGVTQLQRIQQPFKNRVFIAFVLVFLGTLGGAMFSNDVIRNMSRTMGAFLMVVGALGFSKLLEKKNFILLLDILMVGSIIYWSFHVFSAVGSGALQTYTEQYRDDEVVNHHIPGLLISTGAFYLTARFFIKANGMTIFGYLLLAFAAIVTIMAESRSNLLFMVVGSLITIYWINPNISKWVLRLIPILILGYIIYDNILLSSENLNQRFSVVDSDYQTRTTNGRQMVYTLFTAEFLSSPFGRGMLNSKIDIGDFIINAHNQYLTYILAGGIISGFGVFIFLRYLIRLVMRFGAMVRRTMYPRASMAFNLPVVIYFMTLTTIEQGGLLFFIMISIAVIGYRLLLTPAKQIEPDPTS